MNFTDAMKELDSGRKIFRREWNGRYLKKHADTFSGVIKISSFEEGFYPFTYDLDILNTDDWQLYGSHEEVFNFTEAIEHLKNGRRLMRKDWEDCYIALDRDYALMIRKIIESSFIPTFKCLSSSDWEILL